MTKIHLCLYAPSGSGKSTAARLLMAAAAERAISCKLTKLAQPLYELQQVIYQKAGRRIGSFEQDQVLLESLAAQLRRINPTYIADRMLAEVAAAKEELVLNDDLRDPLVDAPRLRAIGFKLIYIETTPGIRQARLNAEGHISVAVNSVVDANLVNIKPDLVINNDGGLDLLKENMGRLLERARGGGL